MSIVIFCLLYGVVHVLLGLKLVLLIRQYMLTVDLSTIFLANLDNSVGNEEFVKYVAWLPFLRPSKNTLPKGDTPFWMQSKAFLMGPPRFLVFLFVHFAAALLSFILPRQCFFYSLRILCGLAIRIQNLEVQVTGSIENVPCFVCNHSSSVDPYVMLYVLCAYGKRKCCFLAKEEVATLPFLGSVTNKLGCIFVNRSSEKDRNDTLARIADKLKNWDPLSSLSDHHSSLVVFPEGTTTNHKYSIPFKKGSFVKDVNQEGKRIRYQPVRISLENPHVSFSLNSTLVHTAYVLSSIGSKITVSFLPSTEIAENESESDFAERIRRNICGSESILADEGSYRAHVQAANFFEGLINQ